MIVVLAGGVGAARFLRGVVAAADPASVTVVSNTGDDFHIYGTHVSPDLDIVCYTLAGIVDDERGWGIRGDTSALLDAMRDFGIDTWFTLGDADFQTCLSRAVFCAGGGTPSQFAARLAMRHGISTTILPMTDDPVHTLVRVAGGGASSREREIHFQEYWVRDHAVPAAIGVRLAGAEKARPAPGVLDAIATAEAILVAPSNPVVSIGTILSVPGIRDALRVTPAPVVGVSPIVGGAPVRGMADKLLPAVGANVSCDAVAGLYADFLDGFVIDLVDAVSANATAAAGACAVEVAQTMMLSPEDATALAKTALAFAERLS